MTEKDYALINVALYLIVAALSILVLSLEVGCGDGITRDTYCMTSCQKTSLCLIERDPTIVGSESIADALQLCSDNCIAVADARISVHGPVDWGNEMDIVDAQTCTEWLTGLGL